MKGYCDSDKCRELGKMKLIRIINTRITKRPHSDLCVNCNHALFWVPDKEPVDENSCDLELSEV